MESFEQRATPPYRAVPVDFAPETSEEGDKIVGRFMGFELGYLKGSDSPKLRRALAWSLWHAAERKRVGAMADG